MAKNNKKRDIYTHDEEQQKQYTREARLQYDPNLVNESVQKWGSYSDADKERIIDEGEAIYAAMAQLLSDGESANSKEAQDLLERWHNHIRHFYEPTLDILRGLGDLYMMSPDFADKFRKLHPDLPEFLQEGIVEYVDVLETAEIERMLEADQRLQSSQD